MQNTYKNLAKQAKYRMKSGYWQKNIGQLNSEIEYAKQRGLSVSKVCSYFKEMVKQDLKGKDSVQETFYQTVKNILDSEGEVADILGRLAKIENADKLDYNSRQKYFLELSTRYRIALERYKKEKQLKS